MGDDEASTDKTAAQWYVDHLHTVGGALSSLLGVHPLLRLPPGPSFSRQACKFHHEDGVDVSQGNMHFLQSGQEACPALSYLLAHNSASTPDSLSPLPIYRKDEGNELYKKRDYRAAIDAYSLAIAMSPDEASFYGNRAAAHMMILAYEAAIDDCNKALALSPNMIKAYFRKGKALATLGENRRV